MTPQPKETKEMKRKKREKTAKIKAKEKPRKTLSLSTRRIWDHPQWWRRPGKPPHQPGKPLRPRGR